mmetsp:Transcript_1016/g.2310  ORF Transcript_1016/g.2310 Transcript_1016/m.2310 type:complete len:141 (+) Transcript_1016:931-1353(+)
MQKIVRNQDAKKPASSSTKKKTPKQNQAAQAIVKDLSGDKGKSRPSGAAMVTPSTSRPRQSFKRQLPMSRSRLSSTDETSTAIEIQNEKASETTKDKKRPGQPKTDEEEDVASTPQQYCQVQHLDVVVGGGWKVPSTMAI